MYKVSVWTALVYIFEHYCVDKQPLAMAGRHFRLYSSMICLYVMQAPNHFLILFDNRSNLFAQGRDMTKLFHFIHRKSKIVAVLKQL